MLKMLMATHSPLGKIKTFCFSFNKSNRLTCSFSLAYVFVIGKGQKSWVSLPAGKGLRLSVAEERDRRLTGKHQ